MKQTVHVEIAGQRLSVRSDEGAAYVQSLADWVDAHLRALAGGKKGPQFNLQRMALLVAMQIADELFREKDLSERLRARVAHKLDALEARLAEHEASLDVPEA